MATTSIELNGVDNVQLTTYYPPVASIAGAVLSLDLGPAFNPMTTLGDIIYGAIAGVPTRLPGNITTTAEFLSSTGTGSVSAAPAWVGSTGTGLVVLQTSPTLITPYIGVAIGTTLALGGTLDSLLTVEGTC